MTKSTDAERFVKVKFPLGLHVRVPWILRSAHLYVRVHGLDGARRVLHELGVGALDAVPVELELLHRPVQLQQPLLQDPRLPERVQNNGLLLPRSTRVSTDTPGEMCPEGLRQDDCAVLYEDALTLCRVDVVLTCTLCFTVLH